MKYFGMVCLPIFILVDEYHNPITCISANPQFFAIIYAFGYPDSPLGINRHIGRVVKQRAFGPQGYFKIWVQ